MATDSCASLYTSCTQSTTTTLALPALAPFSGATPVKLTGFAALTLLTVSGWNPAPVFAQLPTFVEFRVPKAPTVAAVGDSTGSLSYELLITNLTATPQTLRRVEVVQVSDGRVLHSVADSVLAFDMSRPGVDLRGQPWIERTRIGGGLRAQVFLWVPVDRNRPPAEVRHRLTFQAGTDGPTSVLEGASVPVDREVVLIGPPLRGEWVAVNGPSNQSG